VTARVAVIQFPGVNCEGETVRALERAGLAAEIFRATRAPAELERFQAFVLPGGFSYQDRVRGGALAAKGPLTEAIAARAAAGDPVLGICNGAQVLAEAGLVPGDGAAAGHVGIALARNRMPDRAGYYARWVRVRVEASPCLFTRDLEPGTVLALPVAHGEGRFTAHEPGRIAACVRDGQAPLRYAGRDGGAATTFPDNPNGAEEAVAALCNPRGNVLALMPHPERAVDLGAMARSVGGAWGARRDAALEAEPRAADVAGGTASGDGPGLTIFRALARHLAEAR
jgi:phosphoribosylformylglycinamidine synthase subunit PurQ / glutaminase